MTDRWWIVLGVLTAVALGWFTVWFTTTCAASHGGDWWCWIG